MVGQDHGFHRSFSFYIQELLIGAFLLFQSDNLILILRKLFSILSWLPSKVFLFLVGLETLESVQSIEDVNFYVNYLLWFQVIIKPCQWKCKQNRVSRGWGIHIAAHCNQPLLKIHLISVYWFIYYHSFNIVYFFVKCIIHITRFSGRSSWIVISEKIVLSRDIIFII